MRGLKLLAIASLSCLSLAAHAVVIDFETVASDQFSGSQDVEGFNWLFSASGWFIGPHTSAFCPDCTSNGTSNLVAAGDRAGGASDTADVVMTALGGGVFDLFGLDAATANSTEVNRLGVLGVLSGGGSVFEWLDIDGTFDSYVLSGFTGLVSVAFYSEKSGDYNFGGFSIDNLHLDPISVPEPGTIALFGVGLLGLGAMRRRRRKPN